MGRAERIVGGRERAQRDAVAAEEAARTRSLAEKRRALLEEIDGLVPAAIAGIESRDFEGGRIVKVERKAWFGGFKKVERAGWPLASWKFPWKDTEVTGAVWLLADGTLVTSALSPLGKLDRDLLIEGGPAWRGWPYERVKDALGELAA